MRATVCYASTLHVMPTTEKKKTYSIPWELAILMVNHALPPRFTM